MCGSMCGTSCGICGVCLQLRVEFVCVASCRLSLWCGRRMCHESLLAVYVGILCFVCVVFMCGVRGAYGCVCDMCLVCVGVT